MLGQIITLVSLIACIGLNVPFNVDKTIKYDEVVTTESIKQRDYQHTENVGNTVVTYKYESNEVNNRDDIQNGNIYHMICDESLISDFLVRQPYYYNVEFNFLYVNSYDFTNSAMFDDSWLAANRNFEYLFSLNVDNDFNCYLYYPYTDGEFNVSFVLDLLHSSFSVDCVVLINFESSVLDISDVFIDYQQFSYTDYNVIESVTYEQPTTIVGVINEFCENYLFSEIPFVNAMTFEIGGQSVNLMTWLVMLVGIALSIGILILLFVVFKWLFLLFAGIFKR